MARFDFASMSVGSTVTGDACITELQRRTTRRGNAYIKATLRNASGSATAKVWDRVEAWDDLVPGDPVQVQTRVEEGWQGGAPELVVQDVERLPDSHPIARELHPVSCTPLTELEKRFEALADAIERPEARILLDVVLDYKSDGRRLRDLFMEAPAATHHHHQYLHGLLEHSCEVAEGALRLASVEPYAPHIDESAVTTAALLHDLGKVTEYEFGPRTPIRVSHDGRLRSHLASGSELVALAVAETYALEAGAVTIEDVRLVQHVIQSHHGEYGSPVQPACMEAVIVHLADMASARLNPMMQALKGEPLDEEGWAHPAGWKRSAVWHFLRTTDRGGGDGDGRYPDPESEEAVSVAPQHTSVLVLAPVGGDNE